MSLSKMALKQKSSDRRKETGQRFRKRYCEIDKLKKKKSKEKKRKTVARKFKKLKVKFI